MKALGPLLAVLALVAAGLAASQIEAARMALLVAVPYAAFAVLLAGFCRRVIRWAWAPVPFHIPVTCGQQRSLRWIRSAKIDNPSSGWGVAARMAGEVFLFRSLFRNHRARIDGERLILGDALPLWAGALALHGSLLVILLRHLRLFVEPVPACINLLERADGYFQIGAPPLYLSDAVFGAGLIYLIARRFGDPAVRYVSLFSDYFALFLLLGVGASGALMRYVARADVAGVKQYALGLAAFRPVALPSPSPIFLTHLLLICVLAAYLPFSKLMHLGGIFLSPTRNLANNSRARRHINPWNYPVKTHTYAEWEEEFRDKLQTAGIPLETEDAGNTGTH